MKPRSVLIILTLMALCGGSAFRKDTIEDKSFIGNWTAHSKYYVSIFGDMIITQDKIEFTKKGIVEFEVAKYDGKEYILKISKDVGNGRFMRLGPITLPEHSSRGFSVLHDL